MRALVVLVLLVLAFVLLLTWALWDEGGRDGGRVVSDHRARAAEQPIAASEAGRGPVAATSGDPKRSAIVPAMPASERLGPVVRSATGLKLTRVWLVDSEGGGVGSELVDRRLAIAADADVPIAISAPGHKPAPFDARAEEIVLEPDGLLVLHGAGTESCAVLIVPCAGSYVEEPRDHALDLAWNEACFGMLEDGRYAIAFGMGIPNSAHMARDWQITVFRRDRTRIELAFPGKSGLRAEWKIPCDDVVSSASLAIEVDRREGDTHGEVVVGLNSVEVEDEGDDNPIEVDLGWGRASTTRVGSLQFDRVLDPASSRVEIADLPLGRRYGLSAYDRTSGAFARVGFEHDGSARRLVLEPGWIVRGQLVAHGEDPLPERAWIYWERETAPGATMFGGGNTAIQHAGRFEARGPSRFPANPAEPFAPGSRLQVHVHAAGFQFASRAVDAGAERIVDCGTIELEPRRYGLCFAAGHGLPAGIENHRPQLRLALDGGHAWQRGEIDSARFFADGRVKLFFIDKGGGADGEGRFETYSAQPLLETFRFGGDRISALYIDLFTGGMFFERAASGCFERVATKRRRLEIFRHPQHDHPKRLNVGWEWKGISFAVGPAATAGSTEPQVIFLDVPEQDVCIWWGTLLSFSPGWKPPPGEGAIVPLTSSLERLTIP